MGLHNSKLVGESATDKEPNLGLQVSGLVCYLKYHLLHGMEAGEAACLGGEKGVTCDICELYNAPSAY